MTTRSFVLGTALLLGASAGAIAAPLYNIVDLGVLPVGLQFSQAYGLNDNNQVVGLSGNRAFFWESGVMTDLNPLLGDPGLSFARGINNSGQITGKFNAPVGWQHAFVVQQGVGFTDLGVLSGGSQNSFATAINNAGVVVGESHSGLGDRAFRWQQGTGMTDLTTGLPADIYLEVAQGINTSGQIVGRGHQTNLPARGFLLDTDGTLTWLNSTGGLGSWAYGVNDSGDAVGDMYDSVGPNRAALWRSGVATELGALAPTFQSRALDINNADQVVGYSVVDAFAGLNAFLWLEGEGMLNLNDLLIDPTGWLLQEATAINESGAIVGYGLHDGVTRGFLLTPQVSGVPEPGTLGLLAVGLLGFAARRRRAGLTSP